MPLSRSFTFVSLPQPQRSFVSKQGGSSTLNTKHLSPKQKHAPLGSVSLSLRNFGFSLHVLSNKQIISLKASIVKGDFISQILHQSKGFKFGRILGFLSDSSCFDFGFDRTLGKWDLLICGFYNVFCLFESLVEAWLATKWILHIYIATS